MTESVTKALQALHKIHLKEPFEADETIKSLKGVATHLDWLVSRHASKKYEDEYLTSQCFSKKEWFNNTEYSAYSRVQLQLATRYFKKLVLELDSEEPANVGRKLELYENLIHDLLHDIRPYANHLETRKDKSYCFFEGGKSPFPQSFALYIFSKKLYYGTISERDILPGFHQESHVASAFMLRQALEVKFERIIGVTVFDRTGGHPKLKHGFHYDFAKDNKDLFDFQSLKFQLIKRIYDWCSHIVHKALQPLAWQMPYAYEICDQLFSSGDYGPNGGWSIYGGVRVLNTADMQTRFAEYLLNKYDHGIWCFYFREPEAADFTKQLTPIPQGN